MCLSECSLACLCICMFFLSLLCVSVWSSVQMLGYHLYLEEKEQYFFSPHKQNISASGRIFPTDKTHPFLILIRLRFSKKRIGEGKKSIVWFAIALFIFFTELEMSRKCSPKCHDVSVALSSRSWVLCLFFFFSI